MTRRALHISRRALTVLLGLASSYGYAQEKTSKPVVPTTRANYLELMKPIDILAPPPNAKRLLSLADVYRLVRTDGVALKVAREDLASANEVERTRINRLMPTLSLSLGNNQRWQKSLVDGDVTDDFNARDKEVAQRSWTTNAGLNLSGSPLNGVSWGLELPSLASNRTQPSTPGQKPERLESGSGTLSLKISLLKDAPFLTEAGTERKKDIQLEISRATFRAATIKALAEAERNFYELAQRWIQLVIQERSWRLAKALREDVDSLIAAGESSKLEAMRADLELSRSETDLLQAQIDYEAAVTQFRTGLAFDDTSGAGVFPDPAALSAATPDAVPPLAEIERNVLKSNPDLDVARLQHDVNTIDLALARRAALPDLGLTSSYGNSAPAIGWDRATAETLRPNDRVFSVGLALSWTILNNSAHDAVKQSIISNQKSRHAVEQARQSVLGSVSSLVKRLEIGQRRMRIAKMSREMAEQKLNAEYERFRVGESGVRAVIDSQSEVASARIAELGARVTLLTGFAELRTLTGKLPEGVSMSGRRSKRSGNSPDRSGTSAEAEGDDE